MPSQFGWMDHDESQRRRMLAAIELFKDEGTVDELGVGAVRDTIAGALFPGVSVLHTRARYLLFVPWCLNEAAGAGSTVDEAARLLRRNEIEVLHALLSGDPDQNGLIGRVAKEKLKRMPSSAYWSVLQKWGIRRTDTTISGFLRDAQLTDKLVKRSPAGDEADPMNFEAAAGFDSNLPAPPDGLHESTSFALRPAESHYLADRWRMSAKGSLLPWLLNHGTDHAEQIWLHPQLQEAPDDMRELIGHGQLFSRLMYGAALIYNLLLGESYDDADDRNLVGHYTERLREWQTGVRADGVDTQWDAELFWVIVRRLNPNLARPTQTFVNRWVEAVADSESVIDSQVARKLVSDRERSIKGGRARLFNAAALQRWSGASGLVQMDFNWRVTRRLADDIIDGLAA